MALAPSWPILGWARTGGTDVHTWPLAYGFESFENCDVPGVVIRRARDDGILRRVCSHYSPFLMTFHVPRYSGTE